MVVGITGGIGSGKSTVVRYFLELPNTIAYVADDEAKNLMHSSKEIQQQLSEAFGEGLYINGELQRAVLAEIVFGNPDKLHQLNAIVHPAVRNHFLQFIEDYKEYMILYENAILFETQGHLVCDYIIMVSCPKELRMSRVMARDLSSQEAVSKRMQAQWSETKKELLSHYIIYNTSHLETKSQVRQIHNILTKKS